MDKVTFRIPIHTISESNARGHWRARARRAKQQRSAANVCTHVELGSMRTDIIAGALPVTITMVRISAGTLDDDNLRSSGKAVRDGIADALEVDDGDKRLTWRYDQRKGRRGEYGVEVTIEI